ncbi:MAG: DUF1491 family protein [Sphingomicrobium sp.]
MSEARLAAAVEASGLVRRVEEEGGFATILKKGDPERGALLLQVTSRGQHAAFLERVLGVDGNYAWRAAGPPESSGSAEISDFLARRTRFDPDIWLIELDIPLPERFIAETIASG